MSGYACKACDVIRPLFGGDAGETLARDFDVPLLAKLPFAPNAHPSAASVPAALSDAVTATRDPLPATRQ
jgi:hypothetical protein